MNLGPKFVQPPISLLEGNLAVDGVLHGLTAQKLEYIQKLQFWRRLQVKKEDMNSDAFSSEVKLGHSNYQLVI